MAKLIDLNGLAHVYSIIKGMLADKLGKNDTAVNASKVNNLTVETSVPKNAKFTDTVYTHPPTHPASMITGLASVATSGSYNDLTDKPTIPAASTVDSELSSTSTNPVQNKVIKAALDGKLGKNETAARATQDGAGNTITTTYASKADVSALLSTKLGVNSTAYAATRDGAGNNIVDTYARKTDISGMVKSVNGTAPDASGNVNVEEYTHPNSGVTAGTYRSVTVNAQGHVTAGSNPTLAIADGGTGATSAISALSNLGILDAIVNASVSGRTITFTKKDNTKFSINTQDTNNGIVAALLQQNGYVKFSNGLILQWGYCSDNQGFSARMITFPLGFSNACYSLIASTKNESTKLAYNSGNGIVLSKTQAKIVFDGEGGYWFAVGR